MAKEQLSKAKQTAEHGSPILGYQKEGGILMVDGKPTALKHNNHRYNHGSEKPWGRDNNAYLEADLMPLGYHLESPHQEQTVQAAKEWLASLENGIMPEHATIGLEVEGVTYDQSGNMVPVHDNQWTLADNHHPELMHHMMETATGTTEKGTYPKTAVEIAHATADAILTGIETVDRQGKQLVYTSVPEGGTPDQGEITPHPYLLAFSPKVLETTLEHQKEIPQEVLSLYKQIGIDIVPYLEQTGILNWPVNALHVHNGVPQIDGLADPRAGLAMAQIRMTEMAKVLSLMLYNTRHCYGVDTGLKDVRSVMRRLLATSHDSTLPHNANQYIKEAIVALENGDVHSLPRHPWQGQHDRTRIRMDALGTMESIDAPMTPDIRQILAWTSINQILNTIALDALVSVKGDESKVLPYLLSIYGKGMHSIPALGKQSSYQYDLSFNRDGYRGILPGTKTQTYEDSLRMVVPVIQAIEKKYPALRTQTKIVVHTIEQQVRSNTGISLREYMGIESGIYRPNGMNRGLITDIKSPHIQENISVQAEGTKLQVESLLQVATDSELLEWYGIQV